MFAGVGLQLSDADCARTTGLRIDEVVRFWRGERPWAGAHASGDGALVEAILEGVAGRIHRSGRALPGATAAVERCAERGLELAVASSSPMPLILAALDRLELRQHFPVICSAADEERGKPDPAVYRSAVGRLGRSPAICLALEDSLAGVQAALAAGLQVLAVPENRPTRQRILDLGVPCLDSLHDLDVG